MGWFDFVYWVVGNVFDFFYGKDDNLVKFVQFYFNFFSVLMVDIVEVKGVFVKILDEILGLDECWLCDVGVFIFLEVEWFVLLESLI